ncbi:hypothetical protein C5C34_01450 [Rathayibacter rathayi]|nr:hypothetical protein C5C34_01450 [Rathayibacter rathayi]PPG96408.1 hypothetical protein C5C22_03615 [Rathayibacter rathayi]
MRSSYNRTHADRWSGSSQRKSLAFRASERATLARWAGHPGVPLCGRFVLSQTAADLVALVDIDEPGADLPEPSGNIAPTQRIAVVAESMKGVEEGSPPRRRLAGARWGLVPRSAADPSAGPPLINARIESVAEKPSFRESFGARRAIVPASDW